MSKPTILIFVQTGCPACDEFMKRFSPLADPHFARGAVAIEVGDLVNNQRAVTMADQYKVKYTPTAIGIKNDTVVSRLEGAAPNADIQKMLDALVL